MEIHADDNDLKQMTTDNGTVGVFLGQLMPDMQPHFPTPAGNVLIITAKLLTLAELKYGMENGPAGAGGVIIYFVCEDCAVEQARIVKHDGKIMKEKFSIGQYGHIALATDTEGNMIGLHSMK